VNPLDFIPTEDEDEEEGPVGEVYDTTEQMIREKITHVLTLYPLVSTSMLQVGVGASMEPRMWKPVLQKMIRMREVKQEQYSNVTPNGRAISSTRLYLSRMAPQLAAILFPAS